MSGQTYLLIQNQAHKDKWALFLSQNVQCLRKIRETSRRDDKLRRSLSICKSIKRSASGLNCEQLSRRASLLVLSFIKKVV